MATPGVSADCRMTDLHIQGGFYTIFLQVGGGGVLLGWWRNLPWGDAVIDLTRTETTVAGQDHSSVCLSSSVGNTLNNCTLHCWPDWQHENKQSKPASVFNYD